VVAAIHNNQILDAPGDVELTVEVDTEITGPQPDGLTPHPIRIEVIGHLRPVTPTVASGPRAANT
jgi:hypothetical protein